MVPEELALASQVRDAYSLRTPLLIRGAGTKLSMLRQVQAARTLDVADYTGVTLYAPKELVISARAGTQISELEDLLTQSGQHLIAEPPDYTALSGSEGHQTLGGITATNLSGPRRIAAGAMRDHVLGIRAINGMGDIIHSGGRVLKNVTGLDLCKLITGSHGTLAVLTEITLKILPKPESSASIVLRGLSPEEGVRALATGLGSPFGVTGAAHLPPDEAAALEEDGPLTLLRLEDFAASVAYRGEKLANLLGGFGAALIWTQERSEAAWRAIRNAAVLPFRPGQAVWRLSVRPSRGAAVLEEVMKEGGSAYLDWGGGLVMVAGQATEGMHAAVTRAAMRAEGVWLLLHAPDPLRAAVDVVPPEPPALAGITRRVKAALDPAGILNPGRLYAGV